MQALTQCQKIQFMNKITGYIFCLILLMFSCKNNLKIDQSISIDYNLVEKGRLRIQYKENGKDTLRVNIILPDETVRDSYYYGENGLSSFIFYDNSSINNEAKYILNFQNDSIQSDSGKSLYVVSKSFNNQAKINVGDTVELLIRTANPLFLNNSLNVWRNGEIIVKDYSFNVNTDELVLYSIIKDSLVNKYFIVYDLSSEEVNFYKRDTIQFKLSAK